MPRIMVVFSIFVLIAAAAVAAQATQDSTAVTVKLTENREVVYQAKADDDFCEVVATSKDRQYPAIIIEHKKKYRLVYRQFESAEYDTIMEVVISDDGSRAAFVGWAQGKKADDDRYVMVVDGLEIARYPVIKEPVYLSSNGSHYICHGLKARLLDVKAEVVVDGAKKTFDGVMGPLPDYFSPDGNRTVYIGRRGKKNYIVLDDTEWTPYDNTAVGPFFSPDSKNLFCAGMRNDTAYAVIDNVEYGGYTLITDFAFSPDSKHCAYIATKNEDAYLVFDHRPIGPYQNVWELAFSDDGSRFAYTARRGDSVFAVIDSVEQPAYKDVSKVLFSPDSKRYAYAIWLNLDTLNPRGAVVVDGQMGTVYNVIDLGNIVFSKDSRRFGYLAVNDSSQVVAVIDGKEYPDYKEVSGLVFSPDGEHYAYDGQIADDKWTAVIDGNPGPVYRTVGLIAFSSDSKHCGYTVKHKGKFFMVVDGVASEGLPRMYPPYTEFSGDNKTIYYTTDIQNQIVKVTLTPPAAE